MTPQEMRALIDGTPSPVRQPGAPQMTQADVVELLRAENAKRQMTDPGFGGYGQLGPSFQGMVSPETIAMANQRGPVWDRVNTMRRLMDQEAGARAAGDQMVDETLQQARPHAGRLDPMNGPVGPGVVSASMLPDQSRGPTYQQLSDFLAAREGNTRTPEQWAATGAAHDAAVDRIEARRGGMTTPDGAPTGGGSPMNIHDAKMDDYKSFRAANPDIAQRQTQRVLDKKQARKDRFEANRPIAIREAIQMAGQNPAAAAMMGVDPRAIAAMPQPGAIPEVDKAELEIAAAQMQNPNPAIAMQAQQRAQQILDRVRGAGGAAPQAPVAPSPAPVDQINRPNASVNPAIASALGADGPSSLSFGDPEWHAVVKDLLDRGGNAAAIGQIVLESIQPGQVESARNDPLIQALLSGNREAALNEIVKSAQRRALDPIGPVAPTAPMNPDDPRERAGLPSAGGYDQGPGLLSIMKHWGLL